MIERGDIYYIYPSGVETGSEQVAGRPAVIISNNQANEYSSVVEAVYLTTKPKTQLPTHVRITSCEKPSIAICEQVNSVSKMRLGDLMSKCSKEEMRLIDQALCVSLGIETPKTEVLNTQTLQTRISDKLNAIRVKAVKRAESAANENIDEYWTGFASGVVEAMFAVNDILNEVNNENV